MSWISAVGYVVAIGLLGMAVFTRIDPRLRDRLAVAGRHPSLLARLGRVFPLGRRRAEVRRRLSAAGRSPEQADAILGGKVCLAAVGFGIGLSASPGKGPVAAAVLAMVLGWAGFRLPDFVLARRIASARARAAEGIPDLMDLVGVSVTAGQSPRLALERAPEAVGGPLGAELGRARRDVSLGASWRTALRAAAARTGLPELRRLAITVERSERLGAPVADRLRQLAREVRAERRARREERARRAPVAMLFPLVFLILPAFVLAAVVPALLVATRGIS